MSIEDFNSLPEQRKKEIIVDAIKVAEHEEDIVKFELFRIDNFFVEVSRSIIKRFRKVTNTYLPNNLPAIYANRLVNK